MRMQLLPQVPAFMTPRCGHGSCISDSILYSSHAQLLPPPPSNIATHRYIYGGFVKHKEGYEYHGDLLMCDLSTRLGCASSASITHCVESDSLKWSQTQLAPSVPVR